MTVEFPRVTSTLVCCSCIRVQSGPVFEMPKWQNPKLFWTSCCLTYPVHVEGEEDLVHIAVGVLVHALQVKDGLELEQSDESWWRLSHELVVPVVHVLSQDLVQAGAVVAHGSSPTGSPRRNSGGRLRRRSEAGQKSFVLRVERGLVGAERTWKIRLVCSRRKRLEAESKPQDSLTLLRSF